MSIQRMMDVREIREEQWYPASPHPIQVFPRQSPQIVRIRMGVLTEDTFKQKVMAIGSQGLRPEGNDGKYYYFRRPTLFDAYSNPVVSEIIQ